jgi:hypothetical protein
MSSPSHSSRFYHPHISTIFENLNIRVWGWQKGVNFINFLFHQLFEKWKNEKWKIHRIMTIIIIIIMFLV